MAIPSDPVLTIEDVRLHIHEVLAAVRNDGREFLVGPHRRPTVLISPVSQQPPEPGVGVALRGESAQAMLALAGDALGFALADAAADGGGVLRVPEAAAPALRGLDAEAVDALTDAALAAFHASGGDPKVTHTRLYAVLSDYTGA